MDFSNLEQLCKEKGLRMTDQRRVIIRALSNSHDHPDATAVYKRVKQLNSKISLATVYRTLCLFEEARILERHEFKGGKFRYEEASASHHDHLIDTQTGHIIEFHDERIEALQTEIAHKLGYHLVGHRLELYGTPFKKSERET